MYYYKSIAQKEAELLAHYAASFETITDELEPIRDRFNTLIQKDGELKSLGLSAPNEAHNLLIAYSQKDSLPSHFNNWNSPK